MWHLERSINADAHDNPAPNPDTIVLALSLFELHNSLTMVSGIEAELVFPYFSRQ